MLKNTAIGQMLMGLLMMSLIGAAGCSGGSQTLLMDEPADTGQAAQTGGLETDSAGPALPHGSSSIFTLAMEAYIASILEGVSDDSTKDLEDLVESQKPIDMHQTIGFGSNPLNIYKVTDVSSGVHFKELLSGFGGPDGQTPLYTDCITYGEDPARTGWVTFGLRNLPAGAQLSSLTLDGAGERFYVGVSDFGSQRWRWLGPFSIGSDASGTFLPGQVTVRLPAVQTLNAEGHSYLTIVTFGGEEVSITAASLGVNAQQAEGWGQIADEVMLDN